MAAPAAVSNSRVKAICPAIKLGMHTFPANVSRDLVRARLHDLIDFLPRRIEGRENPKQHARQNCQTHAEQQHREVDVENCFMREREFRKPSHDEINRLISQHHTQTGACQR